MRSFSEMTSKDNKLSVDEAVQHIALCVYKRASYVLFRGKQLR